MPSAPLPKVKAELVATSRRLHQMGWVANHDGNVSVRLTGERLLITPTAVSKLNVDESMLLIVDLNGTVLEGRRKAFSELELHLAMYRARPEGSNLRLLPDRVSRKSMPCRSSALTAM